MRNATRTATGLLVAAGTCCVASCVATSPAAGVGTLGPADTSRPVPVSATRSVAVAFTATRSGQLDKIDLVASRAGKQSLGILAYLITPSDTSGHPAPPAASEGEPGCWGAVSDGALSTKARAITIDGYACDITAGKTYWIQLSTAQGAAHLYPSRDKRIATIATQPRAGSPWQHTTVAGTLEVNAKVR